MTGTEIIEFLSGNVGDITTAVGAVAGSLITAIFLRNNTSIKEFEKIKAGRFDEVTEELLKTGKMTYTEFYKAKNFLSVAKKADKYSNKVQFDSVNTYDFDWFIRFYENVGNISNDEMQEIWAKILAGEINKPHSFSLRTIEVLKNMGKEEAELFTKICKCCFSSYNSLFLPFYKGYMESKGITYSMIMYMSEQGLMYNDGTLVMRIPINKENNVLLINENLLLTARSEDEKIKEIKIKQFPLTVVGRELASLIGGMPGEEDFLSFAKEIKPPRGVVLEMHRIQAVCGDEISFDESNLLLE